MGSVTGRAAAASWWPPGCRRVAGPAAPTAAHSGLLASDPPAGASLGPRRGRRA